MLPLDTPMLPSPRTSCYCHDEYTRVADFRFRYATRMPYAIRYAAMLPLTLLPLRHTLCHAIASILILRCRVKAATSLHTCLCC